VTLIVDAAPLVALGDSRDRLHAVVGDVMHAEPGDLIVPAPVSAEADYLIRRRGSASAARSFLRDVASGRFQVEGLTADEHGTAARLDEQYADLDLGPADLSVVILAHRFRTRRLLTFDECDFRAVTPLAGGSFTLLPRDIASPHHH
jgi:predicted nucleic acid-binding protein